MARLLDDLLDTARITRGRIELHRRPLDLREIVRDAVDLATPAAARGSRRSPSRCLRSRSWSTGIRIGCSR